MTRARLVVPVAGFCVLALLPAGCQQTAHPRRAPPPAPPRVLPVHRDSAPVAATRSDVAAYFKDTVLVTVRDGEGREFDLRAPGQRDSLRALLSRERARWRAAAPRNYQFLLRVGCFCPGTRGWLLMEVRGQDLKAWDRAGKLVPQSDWNTFSVDGLFDYLEGSVVRNARLAIGFDPRWHFPAYIRTVTLPGPDSWGTYEARGLRPE